MALERGGWGVSAVMMQLQEHIKEFLSKKFYIKQMRFLSIFVIFKSWPAKS